MRSVACESSDELKTERRGTEAVPGVPMVRIVDPDGREVARGWYVRHETRQPAPVGDRLRDEDVAHVVARSELGDWNMPRRLSLTEVTPPHRIEVIEDARVSAQDQRFEQLAQVAREMQKCLAAHAYDGTQVTEETADYYAEQLEALGVSVDG